MHIIIVGCGRLGAELALSVSAKGHEVVVVDNRPEAFDNLGANYHGRTLQGSGIDQDVLRRAGIESAAAFAAVTSSDNANIVAARIAKNIFRVPNVVARTFNPRRLPIYEHLDLQTVVSSSWGARRIEEMMTSPQCANRLSLGSGEVEIVEARVLVTWTGRKVVEALTGLPAKLIAVTRGGRAQMVDGDFTLHGGDLLALAVKSEDMAQVGAAFGEGKG